MITKNDGTKFGKTEDGNVWLDPERTSPYKFYQFWINLKDEEAEKLIMVFSFKSVEEIKAIIEEHREAPHQRKLQRALADELTTLVHSEQDLAIAQEATSILHNKGDVAIKALRSFNEKQLVEAMEGVPQVEAPKTILDGEGVELLTFLAENGVFSSKGEARKMVQNGGLSINKEKVEDIGFMLTAEYLLNNRYILIQKGKKNHILAIFN